MDWRCYWWWWRWANRKWWKLQEIFIESQIENGKKTERKRKVIENAVKDTFRVAKVKRKRIASWENACPIGVKWTAGYRAARKSTIRIIIIPSQVIITSRWTKYQLPTLFQLTVLNWIVV